jgi:hypothetical protein
MIKNVKDRKTKSNRAQADYFELLVAQYICHLYDIRFSHSKEIAALSNQILSLPNGTNRLKLQNDNLLKLAPKLKKILLFEVSRKGKIIEVIWQGRRLTIKTTSDVDAEHTTHKFTRFSIKSIAESGLGTIKNLGMRSLRIYLGINFQNEYQKMWKELSAFARKPELSKRGLKLKVLRNKKMFDLAGKNGKKYQTKLNQLCLKAFNKLSKENKVKFLNFILDANDKNLYVVIANSNGVITYKPIEKKAKSIFSITAKGNSGVGYTIYIDNIAAYRIQTNATNGIGISPFCQRVFFVDTDIK